MLNPTMSGRRMPFRGEKAHSRATQILSARIVLVYAAICGTES